MGDTILQFITSDYLFRHFPDHHEGHLTVGGGGDDGVVGSGDGGVNCSGVFDGGVAISSDVDVAIGVDVAVGVDGGDGFDGGVDGGVEGYRRLVNYWENMNRPGRMI